MILLVPRSDKDRQGKDKDKGEIDGERTEDEQGGVRGCKAMGGAGTR